MEGGGGNKKVFKSENKTPLLAFNELMNLGILGLIFATWVHVGLFMCSMI